MANWALAKMNPDKHPPSIGLVVSVSLALGWFLVYFLPWLGKYLPSTIMITDTYFFRTNGVMQRTFMFEQIASFGVSTREGFDVLALEQRSGQRTYLGIPKDIDIEAVSTFLETQGIPRKATQCPDLASDALQV